MTYRSLVTEGGKLLQAAGVAEAELDAWYLLEYLRKERGSRSDRQWYLLCREEEADMEEEEGYRELIGRRAKRIPLQQITGEQEFMGFPFLVNEHVLIPRQDTETLVEEAMEKSRKGDRVLDMCTGSGCILLSLLKLVPELSGTGADISQEALKVAVENGKRLQTEASFLESDLFEKVEGVFDLIVSNPPYIASDEIGTLMEEVRDHEPIGALDGSADGLAFYRRLVQEGKDHLKSGGWMLFEIGCTQAEAVMELLKKGGFQEIYVKKDLAGLDRVVGGRKPKQEERKNV